MIALSAREVFSEWGGVPCLIRAPRAAVGISAQAAGNDPLGFGVIIPGIRAACGAAFPGCVASQNFSMGFNFAGGKVWDLTTFRWDVVAAGRAEDRAASRIGCSLSWISTKC